MATSPQPAVRDTVVFDLQAQLVELQRQNARLKQEIEAKDTKLNSSMRSIKMFWSPELKKERAARKAESEKCAQLKTQFGVVSAESQQRTETIQDLQEQLRQQKDIAERLSIGKVSPASSLSGISLDGTYQQKELETLRLDKERLDNEIFLLQKSLEDMSSQLEAQRPAMAAKDEQISRLLEMIQSKGLEARVAEGNSDVKTMEKKRMAEVLGQLSHLREGIQERDGAITKLQEEIDNMKLNTVSDELQQSADLVAKDSQIASLESQISGLKEQIKSFKTAASEEEKTRQDDKKQVEVYQSHSKFMKAKVESLKAEVAKKDTALAAADTKLDTLKAHQSNQQQHITVLQTSIQTKDQHIKNLQGELESMRSRLDVREASLKEKEKAMLSMSSEHSENSYAVENLKSVMDTKDRELSTLKGRCESLKDEVKEKDSSISSLKSKLSSLKAEHTEFTNTIDSLEATIEDKDRHIEMLQAQRKRSGQEQQEEATRVQATNDKLEARISSLKDELSKEEDEIEELEREVSSLKSSLQEKTAKLLASEKKVRELEQKLDQGTNTKEQLASEYDCKKIEVTQLEREIRKLQQEAKSTKEQNAERIKQLEEDKAAKDQKIDDMDRQLKEQAKKLAGVKRNQQIEREKQAQLINDAKKQGGQSDEMLEQLKDEAKKKDERIAILEEALTESVSIAAEREELLAQQAHTADSAASKVDDLEAEIERGMFETTITNTKNASLVLALNENDIILSYYKSERRRMLEELLEMRQNALLATISEKDANIALLELSPTSGSDREVRQLKAEKDELVTELKEQTQKRMTLITNEENKEISLAAELVQASKDKVLDAIVMIEDSMAKLQEYADELLKVAAKHFPEVTRRLPKLERREMGKVESLKDVNQKKVANLLQSLENDMQHLQDYVHKLLEVIEDYGEA